jgi:hypothetical protein
LKYSVPSAKFLARFPTTESKILAVKGTLVTRGLTHERLFTIGIYRPDYEPTQLLVWST